MAKLLEELSEEIYIPSLLDKQTDIIHDNNQKARVLYTKEDEFPNRNIKIKCHIAQLITLDNTNCTENN